MITLRPRQKELIKKIAETVRQALSEHPEKAPKICVQAPCAFGKTPVMVFMINQAIQKGRQILFLAPRKELIKQCYKMLKSWGLSVGILNNPKKANLNAEIQLSCPKYLINKKNLIWKPDIIFYDEAHGSVTEKFIEVANRYEKSWLFGFTATPYREDEKGLADLYDYLVTSCQSIDLINEGLLIKPEYRICNNDTTVTQAITFQDGEETTTIEADIVINADIIRNFLKICPKAQACVFCPSMEKAEETAEKFRKAGITANSVDSKTKPKLRDKLLEDFENKKFQILCNAMLLKEGWDYPDLECVIWLRNLKSRIFYIQGSNRCMRISKNNPNKKAYILDFYNNVEKFGLPWEPEEYSLEEGRKEKPKIIEEEKGDKKGGICENCQFILKPEDEGKCPSCGAFNEKSQKIIVEAVADMIEVDEKKFTKSDKQLEYDKLCAQAMNKGWNPVAVEAKYKKKFGVWPRGMKKSAVWEKYKEDYDRTKLNRQMNMQQEFNRTEFST